MQKTSTDLYLHEFEEYSRERLCEESAWEVCARFGWVPNPELIMYLTKLVSEIEDGKADTA